MNYNHNIIKPISPNDVELIRFRSQWAKGGDPKIERLNIKEIFIKLSNT